MRRYRLRFRWSVVVVCVGIGSLAGWWVWGGQPNTYTAHVTVELVRGTNAEDALSAVNAPPVSSEAARLLETTQVPHVTVAARSTQLIDISATALTPEAARAQAHAFGQAYVEVVGIARRPRPTLARDASLALVNPRPLAPLLGGALSGLAIGMLCAALVYRFERAYPPLPQFARTSPAG